VDLLHVSTVKTLSDEVLGPYVKGFQGLNLIPIAESMSPDCFTPDLKEHLFSYFPFIGSPPFRPRAADLGCLSVEAGWKNSKSVMAERKTFPPLMNTPLA
tara:strand:- start:185 stop:484 length:300 start_codon:yes stop_codon:yes gene_type:complete